MIEEVQCDHQRLSLRQGHDRTGNGKLDHIANSRGRGKAEEIQEESRPVPYVPRHTYRGAPPNTAYDLDQATVEDHVKRYRCGGYLPKRGRSLGRCPDRMDQR